MKLLPLTLISCLLLFTPAASAQQTACAGAPNQTPPAAGNTIHESNQAAIAATLASADLAAQKQAHQEQLAKLQADPVLQAQIAKSIEQFKALAAGASVQANSALLASQLAAVQNTPAFQQQKAQFQSLCQGH